MPRIRYQRRVKAGPHVAGIATPVNTVLPVITGNTAGQTSTTSDGTWSNADHFIYQWYLDGVLLAGETASSIDTDADWAGQTLSVVVCGGAGGGYICVAANGVVLQAGSAYTGPLDLVPGAAVAWSTARALAASMLGQNGMRLRRISDDAELSFAYDAVTGEITSASIIAWAGEDYDAARAKSLFDHSGNDFTATQATASDQPLLDATTSIDSKPFVEQWSGSSKLAFSQNLQTTNTGLTVFCVLKGNAGATLSTEDGLFAEGLSAQVTDIVDVYAYSDGGNKQIGAASSLTVAPDTLYVVDAAISESVHSIRLNGVAQDTGDENNDPPITAFSKPGYILTRGFLREYIAYSGILSDADRLAIRQNIADYYGITL